MKIYEIQPPIDGTWDFDWTQHTIEDELVYDLRMWLNESRGLGRNQLLRMRIESLRNYRDNKEFDPLLCTYLSGIYPSIRYENKQYSRNAPRHWRANRIKEALSRKWRDNNPAYYVAKMVKIKLIQNY